MRSAISVELDGTLFTCDEPAYAALRSYLDRAGARLGSHPDRAEVIAGLERSIAAKLRQRAATHSGITIDEATMLAALKEVGRVDGPALDGSASSVESAYDVPRTRKLYRLRQGMVRRRLRRCSGVCRYRPGHRPAHLHPGCVFFRRHRNPRLLRSDVRDANRGDRCRDRRRARRPPTDVTVAS